MLLTGQNLNPVKGWKLSNMSALFRTFTLRTEGDSHALYSFLKANAKALADQGKPLSVTVQEYKAKRTGEQNKRYWALLNEIAEQAWIGGKQCSSETWHLFFRKTLIGFESGPDGYEYPISTTTLDVAEFTTYMDKISAYAGTELGIELI